MEIDIRWASEGRASALRHGVAYAVVVEVVYAPESVQVRVGDGPTRIMFLGGPSGAAIVVVADREARTIDAYRITYVRQATDLENRAWEKRQR